MALVWALRSFDQLIMGFLGHRTAKALRRISTLVVLALAAVLMTVPAAVASSLVTVSGVVALSDGTPVGNATVTYTDGVSQSKVTTQTGADGSYSLQASPGSGQIGVYGDGNCGGFSSPASVPSLPWCLISEAALTVTGDLSQDLTLPLVHQVTVHVVDFATGQPVAGARLGAGGNDTRFDVPLIASAGSRAVFFPFAGYAPGGTVITDADGNLTIPVVDSTQGPPGYTFSATDPTNPARTASSDTGPVTTDTTLTITLPDVPALPASVATASSDSTSVTVQWTAPANDGGSPLTGYVITATAEPLAPAGALVRTSSAATAFLDVRLLTSAPGRTVIARPADRAALIGGLISGTRYLISVSGQNKVGNGQPVSVIAQTAIVTPDPPSDVGAQAWNTSAVVVSWTSPSSDGGSPITQYTVKASPGQASCTVGGTATVGTVSGLTNGTAYTFTVTAINAMGASAASAPSEPVTSAGVPGVPGNVTAVPSDGAAVVSWADANANGSAIGAYTVTASPGGADTIVDGAVTTATINGLTNGIPYTFRVVATNGIGDSTPSPASAAITPLGVPTPPTITSAQAGDKNAAVSWAAPNANGSPILGYKLTATPGGAVASVAASLNSATVSGLTNGTAYTFSVTATNAAGTSLASATSAAVTPRTVIAAYYASLGGPSSYLGLPVGVEYVTDSGWAQNYTGGRIYWSAATGAHAVTGTILATYGKLGGPAGVAGFPTTDTTNITAAVSGKTVVTGQYEAFAGGNVYSSSSGAWFLTGPSLTKYLAIKGPAGVAGYPNGSTTNITTVVAGKTVITGQYTRFAAGGNYIYHYGTATSAYLIGGAIRAKWVTLKSQAGVIGYPTSDAYTLIGLVRQNFQHGTLTHHESNHVVTRDCGSNGVSGLTR
jgi:uncharacterized protein with LGFP repeats